MSVMRAGDPRRNQSTRCLPYEGQLVQRDFLVLFLKSENGLRHSHSVLALPSTYLTSGEDDHIRWHTYALTPMLEFQEAV